MKNKYQLKRLASAIVFSLVTSFVLVESSSATGIINKANLSGPWQITLVGFTGCGQTAMLVNVTLNSSAVGTNAVIKGHSGCGDDISTGQTFQVLTLAANGRGTANLSCGSGCGWNFDIQVSSDRSMFNLVDASPANPGNFLGGMAVHQ